MDLDQHARLADLRIRVLAGDELTAPEYRLIIDDLRQGRESAAALSRNKNGKPKASKSKNKEEQRRESAAAAMATAAPKQELRKMLDLSVLFDHLKGEPSK